MTNNFCVTIQLKFVTHLSSLQETEYSVWFYFIKH